MSPVINVGGAVPERCGDLGLEHSDFIVKHDGTYSLRSLQKDPLAKPYSERPDFWNDNAIMDGVKLAFIAIPSDQDQRELEIIEALDDRGIHVVTAAKGALSMHFERLQERVDRIGKSATVGGDSRPLPFLADRMNPRVRQIHGVFNGTMNFYLHGIDQGDTSGQILSQALLFKLAEPGATSHLDVINGEVTGDIPKKASILWNVAIRPVVAPKEIIVPSDIKQPALTQEDLNELIANASSRRYIVSILREEDVIPEKDIIAGFRKDFKAGWVIIGGFRRISDNPLFKRHLNLPGAWNGIVMTSGPNESDSIASAAAPGAGPGPTASSMVQDARHLLRLNY